MVEPVSLAQIKQHLRLDATYADEDDLLTATIVAARRGCERQINRSVVGVTRSAVFAGFPRYPYAFTGVIPAREQLLLYLTGGTVASIGSITYFDSSGAAQTLVPTAYEMDAGVMPALLAPIDVWPSAYDRPDAVTVTYTVSPLSPDDLAVVSQAIRLLVGTWYANRESVSSAGRFTPDELPNTVKWLLSDLRVIPFR